MVLIEEIHHRSARVARRYASQEDKGTVKYSLELAGGGTIETVLVLHPGDYFSLCVSCSVGCPVHCAYCATGGEPYHGVLKHDEIVAQIEAPIISGDLCKPLEAVSFMGMGEPLLNFENIVKAAKCFEETWSVKRILLSTIGIPDRIRQLPAFLDVELYVSLVSTSDSIRSLLIPFRPYYSVNQLLDSLKTFSESSTHPVTISYLLLDQVNDRVVEARHLVDILLQQDFEAKVSLRRFCENDTPFATSPRIHEFSRTIEESGIEVEIFDSKGKDAYGGCGQLAQRVPGLRQTLLCTCADSSSTVPHLK